MKAVRLIGTTAAGLLSLGLVASASAQVPGKILPAAQGPAKTLPAAQAPAPAKALPGSSGAGSSQ